MNNAFKTLLKQNKTIQCVGVINAYIALLAEQLGFKTIYLSGAGVANADLGLPDLGMTSLDDVLTQIRRITSRVQIPLIVDADTGWGSPLNVSRVFFEMQKAGASGAHIEDQNLEKRCGHREGKHLVSKEVMAGRIKAACDGRIHDDFTVIARTDAIAVEGVEKALERALYYQDSGADLIFVEAAQDLKTYELFIKELKVPILANMTEFGKTPLYSLQELESVGVRVALHPLSVFRAMNHAAQATLEALKTQGTLKNTLDSMQTRDALYQSLQYQAYETKLDHYLKEMENQDE